MTNYHVRLSVVGSRHDEVKAGLDMDALERQFLGPYRAGGPITINGRTVQISDVERIRVSASDESIEQLIERLRLEDRDSPSVVIGGPSYAWRAAARAKNVTDQFITGPPGQLDGGAVPDILEANGHPLPEASHVVTGIGDPNSVFIVSGRDALTVGAVVAVLRAFGLRIVEWEHAVAKTGLPNPYVGDVVAAGLRMAGAAVVILTPDDLVRLRDDLIRDNDEPAEREVRGQARPNVYYEAGIADTLGRDRTVIVEIGNVKSFSDTAGRHVVRYDGTAGKRNALADRLRIAGLEVDTSGTDWLSVGDLASLPAIENGGMTLGTRVAQGDRELLKVAIDSLLAEYEALRARSSHSDLSDREEESMQLVFRAQALFDSSLAGTSYAEELGRAKGRSTHERVVVVAAALKAVHAEVVVGETALSASADPPVEVR